MTKKRKTVIIAAGCLICACIVALVFAIVERQREKQAMEEAGINVNKILKKFDKEGIELLKAEAAYGAEYGINASPTFLFEGKEVLDFGSVAQKPGFEFLNPAQSRPGAVAPAGSC